MAENNKKDRQSADNKEKEVEKTTPVSGAEEKHQEVKEAKEVKKEETEKESEKKNNEADLDLDAVEETSSTGPQLEELPEEIKKRLEQNKANKKTKQKTRKKKKKDKEKVTTGNAHIKSTYNNTIVTLTDLSGNVLSWASAGMAGFKGPKKSTPYAAQIITRIAVEKARQDYGLEEVSVFVKGVGTGRESAVRALNANGLNVTAIKDITPIPHNGCRQRKPRRV